MERFVWICLAGALGSGARYLLSGWVQSSSHQLFPWGTLAVNGVGSFLLTAVIHVSTETNLVSPTLRLALTIGALGAFTTYSTFSYETFVYLREGAVLPAATNVAATVLLCLAGCWLGLLSARWIVGH